jgi:hypothetical protein
MNFQPTSRLKSTRLFAGTATSGTTGPESRKPPDPPLLLPPLLPPLALPPLLPPLELLAVPSSEAAPSRGPEDVPEPDELPEPVDPLQLPGPTPLSDPHCTARHRAKYPKTIATERGMALLRAARAMILATTTES